MRDDHGRAVPASLLVAASLAGLEGLLVLTYAIVLAADIHADRAAMGVTTSLFFALLAGMLIACAWYVAQARTWARSPIVVVQVMALGLAWNFLGGDTTWLSVLLAVAAVVVLVGTAPSRQHRGALGPSPGRVTGLSRSPGATYAARRGCGSAAGTRASG